MYLLTEKTMISGCKTLVLQNDSRTHGGHGFFLENKHICKEKKKKVILVLDSSHHSQFLSQL